MMTTDTTEPTTTREAHVAKDDVPPAIRRKVIDKGRKRATALAAYRAANEELAEAVREGHAAGMTEVELASLTGVDRARGIRAMLGK